MGEKFKDMLYDLSDTLITLVIVVLIIGTVSWKISDSMTYSNALAKAAPPEIALEPAPETTDPKAGSTPQETLAENTTPGSPASEVKPSVNTLPGSGGTAVSPGVSNGQKMTINIKSGSTGYAIAKLLVEKGLVKDTQTFIQRVEALKLGSKLKAGTFEVTAGMPLDDLIKVITSN